MFQSTLPHGERPPSHTVHCRAGIVSIHAPAWGATRAQCGVVIILTRFNPRSRMGSDPQRDSAYPRRPSFNPRSRMGSDMRPCSAVPADAVFQSTLPHGERLYRRGYGGCLPVFQSTLPHGERPKPREVEPLGVYVSIHAPAWGATYCRNSSSIYLQSFNPRSRMGSD